LTLHRTLYVLANPVNHVDAYGYRVIANGYSGSGGGSTPISPQKPAPVNSSQQDNSPYDWKVDRDEERFESSGGGGGGRGETAYEPGVLTGPLHAGRELWGGPEPGNPLRYNDPTGRQGEADPLTAQLLNQYISGGWYENWSFVKFKGAYLSGVSSTAEVTGSFDRSHAIAREMADELGGESCVDRAGVEWAAFSWLEAEFWLSVTAEAEDAHTLQTMMTLGLFAPMPNVAGAGPGPYVPGEEYHFNLGSTEQENAQPLGQLNPNHIEVLKEIGQRENLDIGVTGRWGASDELATRRAQATQKYQNLIDSGVSENKAMQTVLQEYDLQYPKQVRSSTRASEVDILLRPSHGETLSMDEFKVLRLSPESETILRETFGVEEIDYYNEYVGPGYNKYADWMTEDPYGVIFHTEGIISTYWNRSR